MFKNKILISRPILCIVLISLINFFICPYAVAGDLVLPAPGVMVRLSPSFDPPILKGIKIHPDDPFRFDFILDKGGSLLRQEQLKIEAIQLIKYFLASLTIPEEDLWVNLSPYEKDRIIPNSFGLTQMGRDLLAEDYMLKQITASLIYPEDEIGKKFWERIYEETAKRYGTTNIPVNTFNKVWIVPEKAVVYENAKAGTAYVVEAKLKVMLEQDYLALSHTVIPASSTVIPAKAGIQKNDINALGSQIVREIVIPELTKEVNEGKNFAQLRQVYNSLILATWYKKKIKDSILAQVYGDKKKVAGVGYKNSTNDIGAIYQRYLQAFKKGAYNYIKEDIDPATQEMIPRKYFSGGMDLAMNVTNLGATELETTDAIPAQLKKNLEIVSSEFYTAMKQISPDLIPKMASDGLPQNPLAGKIVTLEEPKEWAPRHLTIVTNGISTVTESVEPLIETPLYSLFQYKDKYGGSGRYRIIVILNPMTNKNSIQSAFQNALESSKNELHKLGITAGYLTRGRLITGALNYYLVLEVQSKPAGDKAMMTRNAPADDRIAISTEERRYIRDKTNEVIILIIDKVLSNLRDNITVYRKRRNTEILEYILLWEINGPGTKNDEIGKIVLKELSGPIIKENGAGKVMQLSINREKKNEIIGLLEKYKVWMSKSIIDEMIRNLEEKKSSTTPGSIILLYNAFGANTFRKQEVLNLISVYGFPPWRSDIEGNMLVDGENVDKMRGWLERNKEKGRNVQFDHLQALILPFIAHMDADELEKAREAESLRELEIIMSQEREAQLEEARLRGQAMPEPVMEPKPAKLIRKPALAPNLKKVKTSKLFKIAEFLEKRRVTTDPNGQVKRAAEVLIKETSQITGIPMEDDRNWKVAQIAVLESINRKFEQVGQEELRQAVTLVNSRAAIKTREAGLTSKNLALVKIAALLGDAEELHDAYEWIKGEENVVSAERRALLQWEQQHDMAMAANGGIDLTSANMNLQTQNAGEGIKFRLDPAMLQQLQNAPGFVPVIISIQPLKSLPEFLGLNQPQASTQLTSIT